MYNPATIANYFVQKSFDTGLELTPMKLVKLVYISHGWYLGYNDSPLIDEAIQAWKYGPVVESVYHLFKDFGSSIITKKVYPSPNSQNETISDNDTSFLDHIWKTYGDFSGLQLSTLTHQPNTPWDIVWNKNNGKNGRAALIGNELIKDHYISKIHESAGTNPR